LVFLNHGSFGACPRPVFERYQALQRELEASPVEFLGRRLEGRLDEARAGLAAYLGAEGEDFFFFPNPTAAVNAVARSLSLEPGDQILATDHEYGACDLTWEFVCAKTGAEYVRQEVPVPVGSPEEIVESIWAGHGPRTRVLFVSHISSRTAVQFPVEELCQRAREAGVLSIVDGAHAPGQIPVDVQAVGADFYAATANKWLCAPKGSGFLWGHRERQAEVDPQIVSWGYEPGQRFGERRHWQGTRDPAAWLSIPDAIDFQREHGWNEVRARCRALVNRAREGVVALTGLEPVSGQPLQMASLPLPPCDAEAVQKRLFEEHRIEVPVFDWEGEQFLRVSIQGYNDTADVEALLDALPGVL
jgi:isopenicillin-N epimerase